MIYACAYWEEVGGEGCSLVWHAWGVEGSGESVQYVLGVLGAGGFGENHPCMRALNEEGCMGPDRQVRTASFDEDPRHEKKE